MKKQKPKQYEDYEYEPEINYTVGSYQRIGGGKTKLKQIGFIRQVKPQPKRKK